MIRCVLRLAVLGLALCHQVPANAAKPQRIVSLNLCVDQILIDLVDADRVAALSFLSTDAAMSAVAQRAHAYHRVRGTAEAVLALQPDLVIAGAFSTPATRRLLKRLGVQVVEVSQPATVAGVRALVTKLADLVGEPVRGLQIIEAFNGRIERALARITLGPTGSSKKPTALAVQVNNIVNPSGSLLDDAMRLAGLRNLADALPASSRGRVALETIAQSPPDILVFANSRHDFATVLADNLRHPVFRELEARRPTVMLPMWATLCGTPYVAEAVERLARATAHYHRSQQ